LDKTIDDVESWQKVLFNPAWFVMMKVETQQLDKELDLAIKEKRPGNGNEIITEALAIRNSLSKANSIHVFLSPDRLDSARIVKIAFSSAKLIQTKNESKWRLLDSMSDVSRKTVRDLAVKLKSTNPSIFGLLTCIGAVHDERKNEFNLVFRAPENMSDPETLRARVMSKDSSHSLTERFRLATQLAQAICSIHTFGLVHKSIRPENIIIFRDQESALGSAFLLGFEKVRAEEGSTRLTGDTDWEKNLYRHPQRQGFRLQDPYIMQHDIYSLGVCLLEIGLWSSFVEYVDPTSEPVMSQSYNFDAEVLDNARRSEVVKTKLLTLARTELPEKMGTKYSRIVETCLTCLDGGNEDFGDESEFQDQDGVLVAVRYIEKVRYIHISPNKSAHVPRF
jgi:serine/threonine protein kinase